MASNRRCLSFAAGAFVVFIAGGLAQTANPPALRHWSAGDLNSGPARPLLSTPTHLFRLVKVSATAAPESHEGTSDIFFVESGTGSILAGGELSGATPLPDMPGELRGGSIRGGLSYELKPGAVINLPPLTPYILRSDSGELTLVQLRISIGMHPWATVQTQQTTLPVTPAWPRVTVPANLGQGQVVYWPAETLRRAHETLVKRAADGLSVADPRDLLPIPMTRTHAFNFMHRAIGKNGQPPTVEFHEGTTDIYFIVGGTGTLMTEGEIEKRAPIAGKPGEIYGTMIRNGHGYPMKAGDVMNMPPSIAHQSLPDAGGYSYLLIKVNTGVYPWSMAER
jgi:mannose-6-phosphate isomerase-like protein (cupin superfamily)